MMTRALRLGLLTIIPFFILSMTLLMPVYPVQAESGTNWVAQFYNNTTLSDPAAVTGVVYPTGLNFNWPAQPQDALGNPIAGVAADGWSARYVTTETINAGTYEFVVSGNDGYRLYIDGNLLIDEFGSTGLTTTSLEFPLPFTGVYTLIVEHVDISGPAAIQVSWFLRDPSTDPLQPEATPVPQAAGQVERVRGLAVRTGPFLGASLINVARPNKQYPIVARNTDEGVYTWYLIQIDETQRGWVSGRYLRLIQGDINNISFSGSVFDEIGVPPDVGVRGVTRSVMNFRRLPTQRSERIGQLDWGAEVIILARTVQGFEDHWYLVRYNDVVGWIFAPYVSIRGDILNVPIY